jgi:hypothetical protein
MTIHDFVAREEVKAALDVDMARKTSPWGIIAVVVATVGFWAYAFALVHAVF